MTLTLRQNLRCGFLGLNVLMLVIGGIALYEFSATGRTIQLTTDGVISKVEATQAVLNPLSMLRYSGNRFLDVGAPEDRTETLKQLDKLDGKIKELENDPAFIAEQQTLRALAQSLRTYRTKFEEAAARFEARVMTQMDRLRDVEEVETTLMDFFSHHKESLEASRPFLFFMTAKLHLNTYFHTFDDQDFQELISSLENVRKMLETGASHWDDSEAEQWRDTVKQVGVFITAMRQGHAEAQALHKEVKDTLFALPDTMLKQAQQMSTRSWGALQGMSAEIVKSSNQGWWLMVVALMITSGIGWTLPFVVGRSITQPLTQTVAALKDIAEGEGDLTQRLTVSSQDELGEVSQWFNTFVARIQETVASIGRSTRALSSASEELTVANQHMATNAEETATQAKVVTEIAQQVREHVETVTRASEDLQGCVQEIAKNTADSTKIIAQAVQAAEHASTTIGQLGDSSNEIGQVIKVITSIAEQTNLLALNATIEAARAGEAGKGFAVVANEVKELAKQTAESTDGISRRIAAIQKDTGEAISAIARISTIITRVNDLSMTIAGAVEEQSATTAEIGRNLSDAYQGCAEIAQLVNQKVAAAAQETVGRVTAVQETTGQLTTMAVDLRALVEQFKYEDDPSRPLVRSLEPTPVVRGGYNGHAQEAEAVF